jgi:hypothetical protein
LLANSTPCFSKINYKDKEFVPVIDEQTSQNLFEYYLLCVVMNYIDLTDQPEMIIAEIPKPYVIDDVFSVDSVQESVTRVDINVDPRMATDTRIFSGNKKQLKQQVAHLLTVFFNIMDNHKTTVNISYEDIQDRVFKLKEREKNIITDRLKGLTPEERDADTILKINKLGVWSKGLQKGLTTYVAETYDDERELRENFDRLEKKLLRTNADVNDQNRDLLLADLIDQEDMDNEMEQEANRSYFKRADTVSDENEMELWFLEQEANHSHPELIEELIMPIIDDNELIPEMPVLRRQNTQFTVNGVTVYNGNPNGSRFFDNDLL